MVIKSIIGALLLLLTFTANAALVIEINTYNTNEISFSISGTIDTDVVGEQKNWLAVKSDWGNNVGAMVDWIDDSVGQYHLESAPSLTIIENSITFDGANPFSSNVVAWRQEFGDAFYWDAGNNIQAGTVVEGTLSVSGANIFNASTNNFQLVSGFDAGHWVRLEAETSIVPIPAAVWLFGSGLIGLIGIARRKIL